MKTKKKYCT